MHIYSLATFIADFQWNTDTAYKRFCICLMSGCTSSSLSRNKSAARRICGISEYLYFFFLYIWVRKVPWGRKKRQNCCNLETYLFSWHYQSFSVSSCGGFCWNTLYCLYIDASLRLRLILGEEPLPCRLQSYSITQSSGLSLKKAKSRFPSGPEDIFLNVVLLQTWTAVIKHLKHPHQSQKPININYNNRCPQNVKTSVN